MTKSYPYFVSFFFVAVVLFPLFRTPPVDSYPHSTYPMFSRHRSAQVWMNQARAVAEGKDPFVLPPRLVANEEVMQAMMTLARSFNRGSSASEALCSEIADRVAREPELTAYQAIELVRMRVDALRYLEGDTEPEVLQVRARCEVRR